MSRPIVKIGLVSDHHRFGESDTPHDDDERQKLDIHTLTSHVIRRTSLSNNVRFVVVFWLSARGCGGDMEMAVPAVNSKRRENLIQGNDDEEAAKTYGSAMVCVWIRMDESVVGDYDPDE